MFLKIGRFTSLVNLDLVQWIRERTDGLGNKHLVFYFSDDESVEYQVSDDVNVNSLFFYLGTLGKTLWLDQPD